jgi:hypothetical protein
LYSAVSSDVTSCDPHVAQNLAPSCRTAPHDRHTSATGVAEFSAGPVAPPG